MPHAPIAMRAPLLPRLIAPRLPFYYGWVVLGCLCLTGFARQGPAVAVLSVFVVPMTEAFGWSRTAIAGAVSLGGLLAAVVSPMLGPFVDRRGARLVLCLAVLGAGLATMALSLTQSLGMFYLLIDVNRWRAWAFPLVVFGANALLAYIAPILVKIHVLQEWRWRMADGSHLPLQQALLHACIVRAGRIPGGWLYTIGYILLWWIVLYQMYRKRVYLRV